MICKNNCLFVINQKGTDTNMLLQSPDYSTPIKCSTGALPHEIKHTVHTVKTHKHIKKMKTCSGFVHVFFFTSFKKKYKVEIFFDLEVQLKSPPAKTIQSRGEERKSTTYNIYPN